MVFEIKLKLYNPYLPDPIYSKKKKNNQKA